MWGIMHNKDLLTVLYHAYYMVTYQNKLAWNIDFKKDFVDLKMTLLLLQSL